MPWRLGTRCTAPGCVAIVERPGRCAAHRRPGPWDRLPRHKLPSGWTALRNRVLREEPTCRSCGAKADTVDHVIPRWAGGSHDRSNLAAMCLKCHRSKSSRDAARLGRKR